MNTPDIQLLEFVKSSLQSKEICTYGVIFDMQKGIAVGIRCTLDTRKISFEDVPALTERAREIIHAACGDNDVEIIVNATGHAYPKPATEEQNDDTRTQEESK